MTAVKSGLLRVLTSRPGPRSYLPSFEVMSMVIMKSFVPLNSKDLLPTRYASTSLGISTNPSLRGTPKYFKFVITTGSQSSPRYDGRFAAGSAGISPAKKSDLGQTNITPSAVSVL